jgi:hypothetical protein
VVVAQSLRAVKQRGPWGGQVRRECTHQAAASPGRSRARTVLENAYPNARLNGPSTLGDLIRQDNSTNNDYQQLANVVILVSLAIAGCTLAAGIAAGLADRKRPFSLLRLTNRGTRSWRPAPRITSSVRAGS